MTHPEPPSRRERLEAAAISLKMIAAMEADTSPFVATLAHRFSVDEAALRGAARSRATQRTYDRIHSNAAPVIDF